MQKRKSPPYRPPRKDWNGLRTTEQGSVGRCPKTNKLQYESAEEARTAAKRFRKVHGPRLKQYGCQTCGFWHNGHNRKGKAPGKAYLRRRAESAIVKA